MSSSGAEAVAGGDRRVLHRALAAGAGVWVLSGLLLGIGLSPGGGRAVFAGVSLAFALGALVAAGWALLALALDLAAGRQPARARLAWTFALVAVALTAPLLAVAATPR